MARIELITEQFGYDEHGRAWKLVHVDPPEWAMEEEEDDEVHD